MCGEAVGGSRGGHSVSFRFPLLVYHSIPFSMNPLGELVAGGGLGGLVGEWVSVDLVVCDVVVVWVVLAFDCGLTIVA